MRGAPSKLERGRMGVVGGPANSVGKTGEGPRRILVADDDPAILRLVTTIAQKDGFEVLTARDGREAYKILQEDSNFIAAIFDVVMPHIQGTELVKYMMTEKRLMRIPVMMMTAEQNPKLPTDSFAAGAVVFLPKPFTTTQLQMMLRMLVNRRSQ
jgi:DNA-binding response OmpR family regulator